MSTTSRTRRLWMWIATAAVAAPSAALATAPQKAAVERVLPAPRPAATKAAPQDHPVAGRGLVMRGVLDALTTHREHEASTFEPPGKPPDRPPDNPGHNGPPNPPGKPPDRPPSNSGGGQH